MIFHSWGLCTTIVVYLYFLNRSDDPFISCNEELGYWEYNHKPAEFFGTLHVALIIISALQAERIFYSIPLRMGWFKLQEIRRTERETLKRKS